MAAARASEPHGGRPVINSSQRVWLSSRAPTRRRRSASPSRGASQDEVPVARTRGPSSHESSSSTRMPRPRCPSRSSRVTHADREVIRDPEHAKRAGRWPALLRACGGGAAVSPAPRSARDGCGAGGASSRERCGFCVGATRLHVGEGSLVRLHTDGVLSLSRPAGRPVEGLSSMMSGISSSGRFAGSTAGLVAPGVLVAHGYAIGVEANGPVHHRACAVREPLMALFP